MRVCYYFTLLMLEIIVERRVAPVPKMNGSGNDGYLAMKGRDLWSKLKRHGEQSSFVNSIILSVQRLQGL